MTGSFVVQGIAAARYKSFKVVGEEEWPPRFTKMELIFENGARLAFCDPRRFGRVKLRNGDPTLSMPISELARDPIVDGIDLCMINM
jgi:formamidopyrimidine-DNA glycosylase